MILTHLVMFQFLGGASASEAPAAVVAAAYPAYPKHRRRIQVQRRDGSIIEVESESEAVALLQSIARRAEQAELSTSRKAVKAAKPAIKAAEVVTLLPAVDFFASVEQPKKSISEATFVKMMRAAIVAAAEMQEEDDVESMLLAA